MASEGWISLHRQIQDHWLWTSSEPFDQRSAWIDLLLLANHKDRQRPYKGEIKTYHAGEVNVSLAFLAKRWRWSRKRVRRFINLLEKAEMVSARVSTNDTVLTLINWGKFQGQGTTRVSTIGSSEGTSEGSSEGTINNNVLIMTNNVNKAPDGAHITETEDEDEAQEAPKPQYQADPDRVEELMAKARERLFNGNT